jgi:3-dehydroquinate dehydratase / shikimate dehydrogenase
LLRSIGFQGLSVTRPHKEKILSFLHYVHPIAREIGAVNTLRFAEGGLEGYNTDASAGIDALGEPIKGKHLVCLGAGGAAKALAYEGRRRGAEVTLLTRANLQRGVPAHDILINATSDPSPIDPEILIPGSTFMEINTHFIDTPLLQMAKKRACKVVLGKEMFWRQALGQFSLWKLIEATSCQNICFSL